MRKFALYIIRCTMALMAIVAIASCVRRPLEVYYPESARIRIDVDWMSRFGRMQTGMSLYFYPIEGGSPRTFLTNDVKSTYVDLEPGTYKVVIFNQSVDEFGSMGFRDQSDYLKFRAIARPLTTYQPEDWDSLTSYMRDPEPIGVALDTITITQEMMEEQIFFTDYRNRDQKHTVETSDYVYNEIVDPMTTTLEVRVHVRGLEYINSLKGNINGLSNGFYLSQLWRHEDAGALYLETWKAMNKTRAEADTLTEGWLQTSIPTFGLPHGKELLSNRTEKDSKLRLCFTLVNGKKATYDFDVGRMIHYQNGEDIDGTILQKRHAIIELQLLIEDTIIIPYAKGGGSGSGFDAEVEPWEDGGTIDIGF